MTEAAPAHSSLTAALLAEAALAKESDAAAPSSLNSSADAVASETARRVAAAAPASVFQRGGRPPMSNVKSSTSAGAAAAVVATTTTTTTTTTSPPTSSSSSSSTHHAAAAAALVGAHVPEGDFADGGAALVGAASSFRRARSRSSAAALATLAGGGGLSLLDGGASFSDGMEAASTTSSRPSTPMPSLVEGRGGGGGGGEEAAVAGGEGPANPAAAAALSSPPSTPPRPAAGAATAAAHNKIQRPFSKLGAAAAALVARYVACPTRAADLGDLPLGGPERFASAARLVLHFDVNKTIVMTDGAQGAGAGCVVNMMLSECAWGRLEPGAEPPKSGGGEEGGGGGTPSAAAAKEEAKEDEEEEKEGSDPPLPAPQGRQVRWVAVGRLAADRPLADPQLMTYRSFLDSFLLPSSDFSVTDERERERRRTARQDLKRRFTDRGQPGEMFSSVHAAVVDELSRAQAAACRDGGDDGSSGDGGGERKQCVERCVHGHHLLRPTVLPSFFNLLLHLQSQRRRFTLVLRSFGTDLPAVIDEINAFAEGRHPSYPRARLDGSDGRVDVRISGARGHLGAFVRLSSRPDGTSLLLGAPRALLAAREYGPKDLLAAAKATSGARLLRTFGEIHAAVAGPPPWNDEACESPTSSSTSGNDGIVSRALALRDYYPFWKASGERGRAGKLFLLDDGESAENGGGGGNCGWNDDASATTPPLSPSPPPPVAAAAAAAAAGGGEEAAAAGAAAANAPPRAKRDPSQVVHVFFDDNVGHGAANIVDARNVTTGAGIPFADVARAHLVRVEPLGAVLDPAFFVRAVHEAVLAASSSSSSSGSSASAPSSSSSAPGNAAGSSCKSSSSDRAPPSDALLLSPRPLRKLSAVSVEAMTAAAAAKSSSSREEDNGGGNAPAAAPPVPSSSAAAAAAKDGPAAPDTAAAALPGEYCHKCGKVHAPKAGTAAAAGAAAGVAAVVASSASSSAAENSNNTGGGSHHASARGKALWSLARARLMTVVRLGVAARLGGAVHETLEGSLTSSVGGGTSASASANGGGRGGRIGLSRLVSEGKTIGEALAEKEKAEKERRGQV